ncbi:hypothetical protein TNCV_2447271 [Trichonephila clavipes]|uniref:Uncharacterized protein n=1 Tax=Trichonephila clavipes TaxID=2585209 RepID=A0A8X6SFX0_TRICX|nr:hypothetical protein TNCV_2447271 [Trichonephila clavipes]
MIVQFRNEKVSNNGSIPITIDCNVVAFIVFEEGFHQPIKRTKQTATAGSDVVQSGRPIFDDVFQHLSPYITNNMANVVFQMVKRLWLIRIDE